MAKIKKTMSEMAKPVNKEEKEFRRDFLVKTPRLSKVPMIPKVEIEVRATPSIKYSKSGVILLHTNSI